MKNKRIIRVSDYYDLKEETLEKLGVFNAFISVDSLFFIDPFLFDDIDIPEFSSAREKIKDYYRKIIVLLSASRFTNDIAWKKAWKMLHFKEFSFSCIGYGNKTNKGNAIGPKLASKLVQVAHEIISLGVNEPEIFELIGLFESGYGPDRLSDMTMDILKEEFVRYSDRLCKELGIQKTVEVKFGDKKFVLPRNDQHEPLILLPKIVLKPLPLAQSWDEIGEAAQFNDDVRRRYNELIGSIWGSESKKKIKKEEIRKIILSNKNNVDTLVEAYKNSTKTRYDFENDPDGIINWYDDAKHFIDDADGLSISKPSNKQELKQFVLEIIERFKKHLEYNGLNHFLYDEKDKPKHERYTQLLFFAVADIYCSLFDVDLSREPNAGSGSVDFKLSTGYKNKILVEIKLSSGKIEQGYTKQLPIYQKSENALEGFFVVVRVTNSENAIKEIKDIYNYNKSKSISTPEIMVIDGRLKPSASKR